MQIIESKKELRNIIKELKRAGKTIGFAPTMGFLHEGHLSLMQRAKKENDVVVASIFVNPTQFDPNEDLDAYPRDAEKDIKLMEGVPVDIAYFPTADTLYPEGYATYVEVESSMTSVLCGRSRPVHFKGVTTILTKLFNLVSPDKAYFGQKDGQQAKVVQRMTKDLDFDMEIVVCPIVREEDGLAMSSRNTYLSPDQRKKAVVLNRSLVEAEKMIRNGIRNAGYIKKFIRENIENCDGAEIDYISVVSGENLEDVDEMHGEIMIALAVKFGKTRLIDNIVMKVS